MNIRKQRFMSAVRIVAQNDDFIVELAERVMEEQLPEYPGSIALLFVTTFTNLRETACEHPPQTGSVATSSFHSPRRPRYTRAQSIPVRWCEMP